MGRFGVDEADAGQHELPRIGIAMGFTPARIESGLSAGQLIEHCWYPSGVVRAALPTSKSLVWTAP